MRGISRANKNAALLAALYLAKKNMKYRITKSTRNAGEYVGNQIASLSAAKAIIRASGGIVRWRHEGDDICAYASAQDMSDEDKAIARLRPVTEKAAI